MGANRRTSWLAVVLAPTAWAVDLEASYALAARACGAGPGPRIALYLMPLAALLLAIGGAFLSWRGGARGTPGGAETRPADRFLAVCGLATSAFFAFVIAAQAIPTLVLRTCD